MRVCSPSRRSVLLVIQGMDASGKDGVIRAVMQGVNPQGCRVVSFKAPAGPVGEAGIEQIKLDYRGWN